MASVWFSALGADEYAEQAEYVEAVVAGGFTDRLQFRGAAEAVSPVNSMPRADRFSSGLTSLSSGSTALAAPDPIRVELEHDVAVGDDLTRLEVADPVMRQVGADQDELSGGERVDPVADDVTAGPEPDQVHLVLGVIVPPRVRLGTRACASGPKSRIVGTTSEPPESSPAAARRPISACRSCLPTAIAPPQESLWQESITVPYRRQKRPRTHLGYGHGACDGLSVASATTSKVQPDANRSAVLYGPPICGSRTGRSRYRAPVRSWSHCSRRHLRLGRALLRARPDRLRMSSRPDGHRPRGRGYDSRVGDGVDRSGSASWSRWSPACPADLHAVPAGRYNLCPDVVFFATPPVDGASAST